MLWNEPGVHHGDPKRYQNPVIFIDHFNIACNIEVVMDNYARLIDLPEPGTETCFLWGPRQSGKSTLLRATFPGAESIDLLRPEVFRRYMQNPEILIEECRRDRKRFVIIDEVQKVPALLDAVHWLIENEGVSFVLCGSSARKVRRNHANLLGGRGIRYELFGLSAAEIGPDLDLVRMLNQGYLPPLYTANGSRARALLDAYVSQYLQEEIAAEGLARSLPVFGEFLALAALSDGEMVNYTTIARDTGVSSQTIRGYFEILEDTLLGRFLPAYRRRLKRRTVAAPKFYFLDAGVAGFLARRGAVEPGSELFGKAFENWVFHELCCYNAYRRRYAQFHYWRLSTGTKVDFLINHIDCAIEVKASTRIRPDHLKGLRELSREHPETARRVVVSLDEHDRTSEDGIEILHWRRFLDVLWSGALF